LASCTVSACIGAGELDLKGSAIVRALVGFNVGVEIGQLMFVALFLPALAVLKRGRGASLTPRIASVAVAIVGSYWLGERIFGCDACYRSLSRDFRL